MFRLILTLLFLSAATTGSANTFEFNQNCREAFTQMFSLHFANTYQLTSKESADNPNNAAVAYIEQYADFLKAFISEEEADYVALNSKIDKRLLLIDKVSDASPWKKMVRAEMLLHLAIIKFKRKEYFTSVYYFRKSFRLLEENRKLFPSFSPNMRALGFFHAAIGTVPENYKWLSNLIGLHGTIAQGSRELDMVYNQVKTNSQWYFLYDETAFLKAFVEGHFKKDHDSALKILRDSKFGSSGQGGLHAFITANSYNALGKTEEAISTLQNFKAAPGSYSLHYLQYMQGSMLLNRLDYTASKHLTRYTSQFKGSSFIKSAWHKLAWIQLLEGDQKGYDAMLERVRKTGSEFTDEDKQAQKDALSGITPNIILLRSRLLFDGGLYEEALSELAGKTYESFPGPRNRAELTYRLGRIYDKLGKTEKAVEYYLKTYESGKSKEWYFAANAALLTGMIYETEGNKLNAREWYKKTLALRNHDYQNSIDQKAEAGLERVGRK